MPIEIDRPRNRETSAVQRNHVCIFPSGGNARQIQPRCLVTSPMVIAFLFDVSEAGATQTMELQAEWFPVIVADGVDVGLLADSDLVAERSDGLAQSERIEGQIIVAGVGQSITIDWETDKLFIKLFNIS